MLEKPVGVLIFEQAKKNIEMSVPDKVWVFRMVHVDNLRFLLQHGLYAGTHADRDPDYIFIGDSTLTHQRKSVAIPLDGLGNIGDYVAFYFSPRSPMLYNIHTGYRGIPQRPQADIVYLCCRLDKLEEAGVDWLFTDGHGKNSLSRFFTDGAQLDHVDWSLRWEKYWQNTEEDPDRQRRKQAELLVRNQVPPECIGSIVVFNQTAKEAVEVILAELGKNIDVYISPDKFYY
jgi:hypothetical protein